WSSVHGGVAYARHQSPAPIGVGLSSSELSQRSWSLTRLSQHSAVRFLIVGGLTFTVDETALFVLHGVIGLWLGLATVLAFAFAFGVNFGLNRVWVFASGRSGGTPSSS